MQNQNQILSPMPPINQTSQTPTSAPQQFSKKSTIIIIASAIVVAAIIIAATIVILNIHNQKTPSDSKTPENIDGVAKEINEFNEKEDGTKNTQTLIQYSSLPSTISLTELKSTIGNSGKIEIVDNSGNIDFGDDDEYISFDIDGDRVSNFIYTKDQGDYAIFIQETDTGTFEYYSGIGTYAVETKQEAISLYLKTKQE